MRWSEAKGRAVGAVVLVVLVWAVYWPCLSGGFVWDDDDYVYDNAAVRSKDGLKRIWFTPECPQYYPLTFTTFWLEWQVWGDRTTGYHAANVLLHSAGALLLWLVLRQLGLPGAWPAALVFALHPLHVESVAWITERKNTLSGLFYLSALAAFWRFSGRGGWRWYAATVGLFAAALLSKSSTVMFPAVLAMLLWWGRRLGRRRNLAALVPLLAMSLAMSCVTIWYETTQVRAEGQEWSAGLAERAAVAGKIAWFYLYKLFVPRGFTFNYPRWEVDAGAWVSYLPAAALVLAAAVMLVRRTPWDRALAAGLGTYALGLFPAMGFFNIYYMRFATVADRFAYLPSLGVIALVVCGAAHLARTRKWNRSAVTALAGLVVLFLAGQTYRQSGAYAGAETLYRDTLAKNPNSWLIHNQLGVLLLRRGDFAEAAEHFGRVRQLNLRLQEAYDNQRLALVCQERYKEAIEVARAGVENSSDNIRITLELARLLATAPDAAARDGFEAVMWAEVVAKTVNYEMSEALDVLAAAYAEDGRFDDAVHAAQAALTRAREHGLGALAAKIRDRLALYESERAYHAPFDCPERESE